MVINNFCHYMISLKSIVTRKILDYYFVNPDRSHYINELAGILDLDPKNTHRKLEELEAEGLLKSEYRGKQRYFFLDKKSPITKEYKAILFYSSGWEKSLANDLKKLSGIKRVYLFGSSAKGTMDSRSDIDILIVGAHSVLEAARIVSRWQKNIGREINAIQMSSQEFAAKQRVKNDFIMNVLRGKKIKLI